MLLNPAILALLCCGVAVCFVTAGAAISGAAALVGWDPDDGGSRQLRRERRLLLVEAALALLLGWQLISLFLFVATAEHLHPLITGAMCAAGTLNANPFGYPALLTKLAAAALCGLWLVANRASPAALGTGLVRFKQLAALVVLIPLVAGTLLELRYFAGLDPEVITSCCATLFDEEATGIGAELAAFPVGISRLTFFALLALTLVAGAFVQSGHGPPELYATLAVLLGVASLVAVIAWVAPSYYELPTHHCPFCLLAGEHHYVGYPLYAALGLAVLCGTGAGLVHRLRSMDSMHSIRVAEERRLCRASMVGFVLFALVAVWPLVGSSFRLEGY